MGRCGQGGWERLTLTQFHQSKQLRPFPPRPKLGLEPSDKKIPGFLPADCPNLKSCTEPTTTKALKALFIDESK